MKPPKNFYSNLDRRKQGLPELPEASASDAGKIVKVGEDGAYELGDVDSGLPDVTSDDNRKLLQVIDGEWALTTNMPTNALLYQGTTGLVGTSRIGIFVSKRASVTFTMFGITSSFAGVLQRLPFSNYPIIVDDNGTMFYGYICGVGSDNFIVKSMDGNKRDVFITITPSTITYDWVGSIKYYEITASGSSVSLPSGVTFADVYAELLAGVDVKFTSGARVYTVTSFESTRIRAQWISDLDLTNIEVYVINLASDGTGTVASATFSGS